ncbi:ATP-binding protein [Actinoallomurus sp. CA-150999]|uniref:ATP-binding protein n=1 Tax=Actinoallomurus sp. CA-150999 TaxID=3239887 RepID=UPI003D8C230A
MSAIPGIEGEDGETGRKPEVYRLPLPPHPIAAEQARVLTRLALADWNIPEVADNALLIAAELVTNAMKLGDVFSLALSRQGEAVLIEVADNSEASPDRRSLALDRVDGRGLLLVAACSKDWGWKLDEQGGKTVWAIVGGAARM